MVDRRKFDVSAEAFLIRVVKTTAEPVLMFCASPVEKADVTPNYRIDYSVGSKSAPAVIGAGIFIPSDSIVYTCTAIGQTNHAAETWMAGKKLDVECVGIPGFPGTMFPRIAGIIRYRSQDAEQDGLDFVHGNVLKPVGVGTKVICQLVNDRARVWGGGVARAAAQQFPEAQQQFSEWFMQIPKRDRLGKVHFANVGPEIVIASLIAQEGYGASSSPRIRYSPLERCFVEIAQFAVDNGASIHCPRIGAGLSGGAWDTVEEIIRDSLVSRGVRVRIYELPPKRQVATLELPL
jgi:O-acetyl-ADP-ribose deacetylase (regulator of RNase III)